MPLIGFCSFAGLLTVLAAEPAPALFEVTSAGPAPVLTQRFQLAEGWTGGDVATSIPLGKDRTLWLFGDSFIGKIESGKRVGARMINNAVAWQALKEDKQPLQFFWDQSGKDPLALLRPEGKDVWYWPGDGVLVEDKLYLFCKVVRRKAEGEPGFEFDWFANELLRISNPQEKPTRWKVERCRLPDGKEMPRLGSACLLDGDYLYAYGLFPASACKPLHQPLTVARIARDKLAALDMKGWRYWCRSADGPRWSEKPDDLLPLFNDGAAELSVGRIRGIDGLLAVYTPVGIGTEIAVRHAARPWGPWSERQVVYRVPDHAAKVFVYGAKAHPELSTRDGQLVITWCRNIGALADHVRQPDIYFPQGVEVQLRAK